VAAQREALSHEKALFLRELKRIRDEDRSRFNRHPVLHNKYVLQHLLGRGGFSEVWKAYDLIDQREVAVKIHQLNPQWHDAKKQNYIRHATREYAIHKSLQHPRVVRLFDVFEIDLNAFATVIEYCEGTDLEHLLKLRGTLTEREARAIVIQTLHGLQYLNTPQAGGGSGGQGGRRAIIHYDLKPGNILVQHGAVKITDFVRARDHPPQASHRADLLRPNRRRRRHRPSAYVPDWLTDAVLTDAVCCYVVMWSHVV
jgi:tousled-like kinase